MFYVQQFFILGEHKSILIYLHQRRDVCSVRDSRREVALVSERMRGQAVWQYSLALILRQYRYVFFFSLIKRVDKAQIFEVVSRYLPPNYELSEMCDR